MTRNIAVWIFGLLASGIIGGFLGSVYDNHFHPYSDGYGTFWGIVGGWCLFACLRLWLTPKSN